MDCSDRATENQIAVLAGLLHDIGKFGQRADAPRSDSLTRELCPMREGKPSHLHVLYTDCFIRQSLPLPAELEPLRSNLARVASAHHRPNERDMIETAVRDADCKSSGLDRVEGEAEGNYKSARLESVFSSLSLEAHRARSPLRHRLVPMDAEDLDATLPVATAEAAQSGYATLWKGFCADLDGIPLEFGVTHYIHSLQSILENWTWCIPSSTYATRADIPLYDHAHTTAAIAQALLVYGKEGAGKGKGREELLLFGGELSGIQRYIFECGENADSGFTRLLRARSFVIQMLTRTVWLSLLERTGLESVAKIMDAGGRFVLLLPATERVVGEVGKLREEVERWLLERYHGVVRMSFADMRLSKESLSKDLFQDRFNRFSDLLDNARLKPFSWLMGSGGGLPAALPLKSSDYSRFGECGVCGIRPATAVDGDGRALCHECECLIEEIGRRLPTARFAVISHEGGLPLFGGLGLRLMDGDPSPSCRGSLDILDLRGRSRFSAVPIAGYVPTVTDDDLVAWSRDGRTLEGNPRVGDAKTFSHLAELSRIRDGDGWRCTPKTAVCKADVDDLGLIFSVGLGDLFSIARVATLSRMINHFFASWTVRLVRRDYPDVYVVFAGGDEFFALGPWAQTIEFARRMRREFARFAAGNPDVTMSAGMSLLNPGLPMLSIKEVAEERLEEAKGSDGKDSVSLLGVTCGWRTFERNMEAGSTLEGLLLERKISQSFVRRILGYARECRAFRAGDVSKGLYLSHMQYDMARNCDMKRLSPDEQKWLQELPHPEGESGFPDAEMGVSWALYRTRRS